MKKAEYIKFLEDEIKHFADPKNRDKFDFKRRMIEKGIRENPLSAMRNRHPEIQELFTELKHIVVDTMNRMVLEDKIKNGPFVIRYMKLLFQDLYYYTEEEKADLLKKQSETKLNKVSTDVISIGYGDEDED